MTREEMINFIKANPNVKVTHSVFGSDEYLVGGEDGNVYDEKGYIFEDWRSDRNNGLRMRTNEIWATGWEIKDQQTRYRATCHVTFKGGQVRNVVRVVRANSIKEADKLLREIFDKEFGVHSYTKEYQMGQTCLDETTKPTLDEIKKNILIINDLSNSQEKRYEANMTIYKLCRDYEPSFMDDDLLSDLLSYAEDGSLSECGDIDAAIMAILNKLG